MFSNLKVGTKLALGFGITTFLALLIGFTALFNINSVGKVIEDQNELRVQELERLYTIREALGQTGLAARNAYIYPSDQDPARDLSPLMQGDSDFEKAKANLLAMATELERPRRYREAGQMPEYGSFLVNECSPLRRQIVAEIDVVVQNIQKNVEARSADADHAISQ